MGPVFVIGLDPGAKVWYFAARIDATPTGGAPTCSVMCFGFVSVDFSKGNPVLDVFTNPLQPIWESPEFGSRDAGKSLYRLVDACRLSPHECLVVWEQQRGYLREHLGDPFLLTARELGWSVKVMPPAEKYHRLGVSRDKQVSRARRRVPRLSPRV